MALMPDRLAKACAAGVLLVGCSTLPEFQPFVTDVTDQAALQSDERECLAIAQTYRAPLGLGSIGTAALEGGGNNLAGAAVNPLVPALGAAGGASSALLTGLDLMSSGQRRAFLLCLDHRGERSHAYSVIDPSL